MCLLDLLRDCRGVSSHCVSRCLEPGRAIGVRASRSLWSSNVYVRVEYQYVPKIRSHMLALLVELIKCWHATLTSIQVSNADLDSGKHSARESRMDEELWLAVIRFLQRLLLPIDLAGNDASVLVQPSREWCLKVG